MQTYVVNYVYDVNGQVVVAASVNSEGSMGISILNPSDKASKVVARTLAVQRMNENADTPEFPDREVPMYKVKTLNNELIINETLSDLVDDLVERVYARAQKYFRKEF